MKLGFSLKKAKKKPLLGSAAADAAGGAFEGARPTAAAPEKVFVTAFDPSAPAMAADGAKALVIPLIAANEWREAAGGGDAGPEGPSGRSGAVAGEPETSGGVDGAMRTADEAAAEAVLAEVRGVQADGQAASSSSPSSSLVIPMTDTAPAASDAVEETPAREETARDKKKAALFQDAAQRMQAAGAKPILQQNAVPGLDKLADVKDKYRHDISLRPDALDVHSEAYAAVPIEEFGAAMLRGMGWKGPAGEDEDADAAAPKPRHKLLGLGATMRPPLAGDKNKRRKKHTSRANKEELPPASQRQAGMNRADDSKGKKQRSGSSERQTGESSHGRSDRDEHKRRRRDGDERREERRSASSRDHSRSRDRRDSNRKSDSRNRRDDSRKSTDRRDSRDRRDDRKDSDRRSRERSRSGDRDRDRHRSSRR